MCVLRSCLSPAHWRSSLLAVGLLAAAWPASAAEPPGRALTGTDAANHVMFRMAFGPRPQQVAEVAKTGWKEWVERQLDPDRIDDAELQARLDRDCPTLKLSLSELQKMRDEDKKDKVNDELRTAVLLRAAYSERQFQEVMIEFWRNHFSVDMNKVPCLATHFEEHVLRKYAFARFSELLMATAKHPAMLVFLDNYVSRRNGVNENYARELMELHTLGVDSVYDQKDVIAMAKTLTGWTCGWQNAGTANKEYEFFFNKDFHDPDPTRVVGLELKGSGQLDGERAIRHLARHETAARFITTKLCRYLVSDTPSEELIKQVSDVFQNTNGDLREVYRAILFSSEFASTKSFRIKVKTPFEFTVSVLRATDAKIESPQQVFRELLLMGQPIYECLEPTGYSDLREAWLDPGVMVYRWNFAIKLVKGEIKGVTAGPDFAKPATHGTPAERARNVMALLLPGARDRVLERSLSSITDPRLMTAYALGSPGFQQQ